MTRHDYLNFIFRSSNLFNLFNLFNLISITPCKIHSSKWSTANMGMFSLLPTHLSSVEEWASRIFLLLAVLTFGPWLIFLIHDFSLYIWRSIQYEMPGGGRAQGRRRPRAPSLNDRPPPLAAPFLASTSSLHGTQQTVHNRR